MNSSADGSSRIRRIDRSSSSSIHTPSPWTWNTMRRPSGDTAGVRTIRPRTGESKRSLDAARQLDHVQRLFVAVAHPLPIGEPRRAPELAVSGRRSRVRARRTRHRAARDSTRQGEKALRERRRGVHRPATRSALRQSRSHSLSASSCHRVARCTRRALRRDRNRTPRVCRRAIAVRDSSDSHRRQGPCTSTSCSSLSRRPSTSCACGLRPTWKNMADPLESNDGENTGAVIPGVSSGTLRFSSDRSIRVRSCPSVAAFEPRAVRSSEPDSSTEPPRGQVTLGSSIQEHRLPCRSDVPRVSEALRPPRRPGACAPVPPG